MLLEQELKKNKARGWIQGIAAVIAVLAMTVASLYISSRSAEKYYKQQASDTMTEASGQIAETISSNISACYEELELIKQLVVSGHGADSSADGEQLAEELSYINAAAFHKIGVVLSDGMLWLSDGTSCDVSDVPAISRILSGEEVESIYASGSMDEEILEDDIVLAAPFGRAEKGSSGVYAAAVVGTIEKARMARMMETDVFGVNYTYVVLTDEKGNIILDTNVEKKFKTSNVLVSLQPYASRSVLLDMENALESGEKGTLELMGDTNKFLTYYAPVLSDTAVEEKNYDSQSIGNWRLLILTRADILSKNIANLFNDTRMILYVIFGLLAAALCCCVVLRVTKRNNELRLKYQDPLTGLLKDSRFQKDAELLIAGRSEYYALVSYNVMHFKMINSRLGHQAGDEVLTAIGKEIEKFLLPAETAAHSFADRFTVLLKMDTQSGVGRIRELEQALMAAKYPDALNIKFTIGVYMFKEKETDISAAMDRSRFAQSKTREGRRALSNMVVYSQEMFEHQKEENMLAEMADNAIEKRHFIVYYQAKRDIQRGVWAGSEALVRWKDPEMGFIYPSKIIPLFERNGFIVKLDLYVFETVCRDLHEAIVNGDPVVPVSVNLSKCHFDEENFLDRYLQIMDSYGVPHYLIEFEVTETLVVTNEELMRDIIRKIHQMGCSCSLDDFGTGSSSFHMVQEFEFDTIKLDRSFFYGSQGFSEDSKLIVETMIVLSHKLGRTVISEGIENLEQTEFLREKKCDEIQGYYYAKPAPLAEYKKLLAAG